MDILINSTAGSGPGTMQISYNGSITTVTLDTSTASNTRPVPVIFVDTAGNRNDSTHPVRIDPTGTTAQPVTQSGAWSLSANQSVNVAQVNGITPLMGNGVTGTGSMRVTIASDNTAFSVNAVQSGSWSLAANQSVNVAQINGITPLMGNGTTGTGSQRVTIASDNTAFSVNAVQSGSWSLAANQSVNVAQINGVTPLMGNGTTGTGSQRVTIASDNTAFSVNAVQSGSWSLAANQSVNVAQINGVTPLMGNGTTGTGSQRVTIASDNTAFAVNATLQAGANTIGALTANQSVNLAQIAATTTATGNGTASAGCQRVTIASDNTAFPITQSGTWTVQPGNTANTTAWLVTQGGRAKANAPIRNDYTGTSVTTGAYVQLVASTSAACSEVEIFDSSGQDLVLAVGAAASEVDQLGIFPGGNGRVPLAIPASSRISVKAKSATASVGVLLINLYA